MKKQGFIAGAAILALSAVIAKLLGAVFRIPLASVLGGTGMGYFSSAYSVFLPVYAVTAAGLPAAAARITARNISAGRENLLKIKKTALSLFFFAGMAGTALMLLCAAPFCRNVIKSPMSLPSVIMIAPSVLFGCPAAVLRGFYEGQRNMIPTALSQLSEAAAKLAAGLFGAYSVIYLYNNDIHLLEKISGQKNISEEMMICMSSAAAAAGISVSVLAGLVFMILYDIFRGERYETENFVGKKLSEGEIIRELTAVAVPAALCSLVTSVTSLIDLVTVMGSLRQAADADISRFSAAGVGADEIPNFMYGCFSGLAVTVFNLVPSVTNMFGRGILPLTAEAYKKGDGKAFENAARDVFTAASFISVPCAFGIFALSKEILLFLFSGSAKEAVLAYPALSALSPAVVMLCASSALFPVFQGGDRQDIPVKLMIAGAAVKAAGNLLLVRIPSLNIVGAAVSTDISYLVILSGALFYLKKIYGICPENIIAALFKLIPAGAVCGAVAKISCCLLGNRLKNSVSVVISIAAGGIFYIIVTYFEGFISKSTLKMLICKKNQKNT